MENGKDKMDETEWYERLRLVRRLTAKPICMNVLDAFVMARDNRALAIFLLGER
jgi:hypothetical protein